jgi:hypothetical protein
MRSLGQILGGLWVEAQGETEIGGAPASASIVVARNLGRAFRIEAGTRWERALEAPIFTLSLVSQLNALRSTSVVTASTTGETMRLDQSIGGSVLWTRGARGFELSSEPSLDRGGVGGRVFLDLNGNAQSDPNEPPLPGTRLLVGNRWVTADTTGHYQVWGISPYEELLISVDSSSLRSPWWVPRFTSVVVMPTPHFIRSADVPVEIGGVIEGSLVVEGSRSQLPGRSLPLMLVEVGSGARTSLESFSDGSFYRMALRPGRYELSVDQGVLQSVGLIADTLRFDLRPQGWEKDTGPTISGLQLVLRPR